MFLNSCWTVIENFTMDILYLSIIYFLWFFCLDMYMIFDNVTLYVFWNISSTYLFVVIKTTFLTNFNNLFILIWIETNFTLNLIIQLIQFIKSFVSLIHFVNILFCIICSFFIRFYLQCSFIMSEKLAKIKQSAHIYLPFGLI